MAKSKEQAVAIPVVEDDFPKSMPLEHCCFCFKPTKTWYVKKDVAVCVSCAKVHKVSEVPTKDDWCNEVARRMALPAGAPERIR